MADNFRHAAGEDWKQLGIWCWIPQLPQRHFCLWMDSEFLLFKGDTKMRMPYAAMMLTSPPLPNISLF